jgi:hypothetical protein
MGLSFTTAAGARQRSHSRVPWDSWPYFTVSDSRLPFSSPPTTRRVTVEVFDPASTREWQELIFYFHLYDTYPIDNDASNNYSIIACVFVASVTFLTEPLPSNERGIHRLVGFMKYAIEWGSGDMIHIPSFIQISSRIQKLMEGEEFTDTQTAW